jgi:hypothetical protein
MSEWELRVSQREIHRMHVVRLTWRGEKQWERRQSFWGFLHGR